MWMKSFNGLFVIIGLCCISITGLFQYFSIFLCLLYFLLLILLCFWFYCFIAFANHLMGAHIWMEYVYQFFFVVAINLIPWCAFIYYFGLLLILAYWTRIRYSLILPFCCLFRFLRCLSVDFFGYAADWFYLYFSLKMIIYNIH